jgi:hypothetical protein
VRIVRPDFGAPTWRRSPIQIFHTRHRLEYLFYSCGVGRIT